MQLNIKDDEVYTLARRIATRRGTSLTDVVKTALRNESARDEPQTRSPEEIAVRLARINALLEPLHKAQRESGIRPPTNEEFDAWMYDENGLPR